MHTKCLAHCVAFVCCCCSCRMSLVGWRWLSELHWWFCSDLDFKVTAVTDCRWAGWILKRINLWFSSPGTAIARGFGRLKVNTKCRSHPKLKFKIFPFKVTALSVHTAQMYTSVPSVQFIVKLELSQSSQPIPIMSVAAVECEGWQRPGLPR